MKLNKFYNKKEQRFQYRARFQINNLEFTPVADSKSELNDLIEEIRVEQRRIKKKLIVLPPPSPRFADLLAKHACKITNKNQSNLFQRVSRMLLELLPENIKVDELKKAHFRDYLDVRLSQISKKTGKSVLAETADKELYSVSAALTNAPLYFPELENYQKVVIPKAASGKKRKRDRIVNREIELEVLLEELRKERTGKQTEFHIRQRRRLADDLEFRVETGFRRKEVSRLLKKQYDAENECLRLVIRWKTQTLTKFFPLSNRAKEIVENRLKKNPDSEYIFSADGEPYPSDYRTLKNVCQKIGVPYGLYTEDGFVPHDLRHNFGTEVIEFADIETVRELLAHSNIKQTADYLHTNEKRMREAIRRKDGSGLKSEMVKIYKAVRRKKMNCKIFLEKVKNLHKN